MNFLAHLYLSGNDKDLMIGNFIADAVKGKEIENYKPEIIKGIQLHRDIDNFTDQHPDFRKSVSLIRSKQEKFSGVVMDIFYDHFLAKNWRKYHDIDLRNFTIDFHQTLENRKIELPKKIKMMMPILISEDWLYKYQFIEGIKNVCEGMSRRTRFDSNMANAHLDLLDNYEILETNFNNFFQEILVFVKDKGVLL
jgi:acyl carrier protein phosphodiesterase